MQKVTLGKHYTEKVYRDIAQEYNNGIRKPKVQQEKKIAKSKRKASIYVAKANYQIGSVVGTLEG